MTDAAQAASGLHYTLYAAFDGRDSAASLPDADRAAAGAEAQAALAQVPGLVVRGTYATGAYRAESDLLLWLLSDSPDTLQAGLAAFRRTRLGRSLRLWWSAIGVHREAEFAKSHVPAFMTGAEPREYVCVYPFVRSYDWYLLDADERSAMLREHGIMGREHPDVLANTVSSFALSDYEWLLAFEAEDIGLIVDLMRHLRATRARLHVREELPFITGRRVSLEQAAQELP
ncbi:MAG TPA: hydrogen peroxide-dependent heme synthase [Baekduia sp.]|nr:hydrogen peroxide-dependent heme synthase [Baekduia sp.]